MICKSVTSFYFWWYQPSVFDETIIVTETGKIYLIWLTSNEIYFSCFSNYNWRRYAAMIDLKYRWQKPGLTIEAFIGMQLSFLIIKWRNLFLWSWSWFYKAHRHWSFNKRLVSCDGKFSCFLLYLHAWRIHTCHSKSRVLNLLEIQGLFTLRLVFSYLNLELKVDTSQTLQCILAMIGNSF